MATYLHDHTYCSESLEAILLARMNSVTLSDIRRLEKKTRKNNILWGRLRKTRITTSIAHDIIRTCRSRRLVTPLATSFLKEYSNITGGNFSKCGIVIDQNLNSLSATPDASPDAINDCNDVIVEIKSEWMWSSRIR